MSSTRGPHGICVIDKPTAWTSHDVVAKCRGILGTRKVGHSGTLDPMATGVLVLGVGTATRLLTFLSGLDKVYEATIRFGTETDSLDADGDVTVVHDMAPPPAADVARAAATLTGDLQQVPPMVSAIKVGGRRLHDLARSGVEVERAPRPVTVHRFEVEQTADPMTWTATVECSAGTYVRVLAADLGRALGGGAHLTALRRSAVGPFTIDEAHRLDDLSEHGAEGALLPPTAITRVIRRCDVDATTAIAVGHGKVLDRATLGIDLDADGPWAVTGPDGTLLAVYQAHHGDSVKPALVVPAQAGG